MQTWPAPSTWTRTTRCPSPQRWPWPSDTQHPAKTWQVVPARTGAGVPRPSSQHPVRRGARVPCQDRSECVQTQLTTSCQDRSNCCTSLPATLAAIISPASHCQRGTHSTQCPGENTPDRIHQSGVNRIPPRWAPKQCGSLSQLCAMA